MKTLNNKTLTLYCAIAKIIMESYNSSEHLEIR